MPSEALLSESKASQGMYSYLSSMKLSLSAAAFEGSALGVLSEV